jgi:hypothetical protein
VHDIAAIESSGIPSVLVASKGFVEAAEVQARALGISPATVFVAHPIQDRTDEEMRTLADRSVAEIVASLRDGS